MTRPHADTLAACTCWIHGMHPDAEPCPQCADHGTHQACTHPEHAAVTTEPESSPLDQATERARDELTLEINHWQDRQGTPAAAAILNIETAVLEAIESALAHPEQLENTIGLIYDALGDARIAMNRTGLEQTYREITDAKLRAYIDSETTR